jgi:predicted HTH domain antitoxin
MLTITDEILSATKMSAAQLKQELAVFLYASNKLSFGQARKLAELDIMQFQELLFANNIPMNYGIADLEEDIQAIRTFRK